MLVDLQIVKNISKTMLSENEKKLCELLEVAAMRFEALGNRPISIWSSYESSLSLAEFVRNRIVEISEDNISLDNKKELWGIFAPTSDWDDTGGDPQLGEVIFQLLQRLYWSEIQNS